MRAEYRQSQVEQHRLRPSGAMRTDRLGIHRRVAKRIGYEVAVRDDKLDFGPRKQAEGAPKGSEGSSKSNPLVLRLGSDVLRFRSVVTAAEQVGKVEVRGWDIEQKKKIVSTKSAGTKNVDLPTIKPADMAKPFGDPKYVASDVAYRTQSEADTAAEALVEEIGSSFAEVEGVARAIPSYARMSPSVSKTPEAVRRQVHDHHGSPSLRPDDWLHDRLRGDRAAGT